MEQFFHDNSIYIVLGIAMIIWIGLAVYLFAIDNKISKLEKVIEFKNSTDNDNF